MEPAFEDPDLRMLLLMQLSKLSNTLNGEEGSIRFVFISENVAHQRPLSRLKAQDECPTGQGASPEGTPSVPKVASTKVHAE